MEEIKLLMVEFDLFDMKYNLICFDRYIPVLREVFVQIESILPWEEIKRQACKESAIIDGYYSTESDFEKRYQRIPQSFRIYHMLVEMENNQALWGLVAQKRREDTIDSILEFSL
jgi:hypothetical protein